MSQTLSEPAQPTQASPSSADEFDEFAYRPVPPLAPISLFLGICSLAGFLGIPCLAIGLVGFLLGLVAIWQIRRSAGELGGKLIAALGTGLSLILLVSGSGYHAYAYVTELPEGYERVNFNELAKYPPGFADGKIAIAPEVAALDGKPIYIKGYMYPTRQLTDISEFLLVKDTGQCCFGGSPKPSDMIVVKFQDGMTVNHREQQLVGIGGIFHSGTLVPSGQNIAVYMLEGTHFR